jgi:hypothetical protein
VNGLPVLTRADLLAIMQAIRVELEAACAETERPVAAGSGAVWALNDHLNRTRAAMAGTLGRLDYVTDRLGDPGYYVALNGAEEFAVWRDHGPDVPPEEVASVSQRIADLATWNVLTAMLPHRVVPAGEVTE